ncbi:unnamed protein product [Coregonus sp. 'balchen']|nr:unnamed protein product [Coregonus sp. 'balchen']
MFYGDEDNPDKAPAMWSCGVRCVRMRCFTRTMTSDLLHMGTRRHPSLLRISLLLLLLHAAIAITTTPAAPSTIPSTATLTTTDISSSNTPNTSAVSVPMSNATTPPLTSLTTPHPSPLHTASSNMTNEPMMSTMPYPSTILHSTSPIITSTANMTSKNNTPPGHSTPLPTTFTSNASTAVYYWMILAVEVTGDLKNESDISGWPYKPEQANGTNSTDTLQTTSVSPTYPTPYNMTTLSQNFINFSMTTLTTNMTTMLYNSISTPSHNHSMTTLSPSYTMSPNWPHSTTSEAHEGGNMTAASLFQRALWLGQENSTIQTNIVGNRVERVGKGLCAGQLPPSNGFAKCNGFLNGTLPLPDTCHTPEPVNISCSPCPPIISTIYQDAHVECSGVNTNLQSCRVIVRLDHSVPICTVSTALMNLFNDKPGIGYNGTVTRAGSSGGLLNSTFMWKEINLNPTMFCELNTSSLPLYTTLAPLNTTSTAPNTTLSAPNTTIATTTLGNTTTNPSTPIIPPVNHTTASPKYTTTAVITTTTAAPNTTAASSVEQANQLLDLTSNVSKLNSSQVDQLVSQLEALLAGPNVSLALGQTSVKIVSNLLGASSGTLASSSTKIIGIVDTVGLKLVVQQEATILTKSVAVAVKTVDGTNFQQTSFSIPDPNNVQIRGGGRARRSVRAEEGSLPQGSVTFPSSLTANLSPEQQLQASRLQFNFYQKSTVFQDRALGDSRLYSGILGASVANLSIKSLQEDVVITLRNTEPVPANFVVSCAFWDFGLNGGSGGWNRDGCSVRNSTDNETVCACNHLTSFGVLLDISRTGITNRLQATILTYITYIGCGISAIFLSITLLTYLAFGKLRKDMPSKILIQLCVALLFLNLVFLVDSWLALYPDAVGLCISTAWFLHYFLLASFTWMGLEAVHMYLALVKVFNTYITRYMLKFSLVGWGVPLLVVIVVIAVDKDNYGLVGYGKYSDGSPTDDFCWLKNNIAFYVSVVAYFCVIFLLNLSMFVVVMVQLCRIKSQNPHNMRHRNGLQDLRSVLGITLLLGLTWGFAFFAWGPVNLAFMYLFAIFNSFQGFFIFVFYCAVKENVRRQWRTYLCCDWSRTATQKTGKKSLSVTRATSLRSYNSSQFNHSSSSSFLTGDSPERPSGATESPFDDRTITALEELNSDVVLNEVNSQFRTQSQRAP